MTVVKTILDALLLVAVFAVPAIWIVALCNWDGKCPCKPEDCEDCPYSGTGCGIDPKTQKNQTDNGHK